MKFFNIDMHISVIEDIKHIFNELGHSVDSCNLSGHNWVFNRNPGVNEIINVNNWQNINEDVCERFYSRYKDEYSKYDGFVCAYPPAFSLLFRRFDKPIIVVAATRYDYPIVGGQKDYLDSSLVDMFKSGQLFPVANNKYDKMYCEKNLKFNWTYIPSLCEYTKSKYNKTKDESVLFSKHVKINNDLIRHYFDLGSYSWNELYSFKSIVHMPYNVSTMSIFEQYTANVPMLFPSAGFLRQIPGYMSEISFSSPEEARAVSDYDIALSDFYDDSMMPYIIFYESYSEILDTLNKNDTFFEDVSYSMCEFNKTRREFIITSWENILLKIT